MKKQKVRNKYESFRNMVLEEAQKGNVVVMTIDGAMTMPLKRIINQPTIGLLYDLNRDSATVLTWIKDPKWVNDYAVLQVITELKKQVEELKSQAQTGDK